MAGDDDGLPQQYNASMAYHKLGYAFYEPESSFVVKPGSCGYIDGSGSWHRIVDVVSTPAAEKAGYSKIKKADLIKLPVSTRLWGPKSTETVTSTSSNIEARASVPTGIPAEASALVEFTLNSEFGAVLLCKGNVTKRGYDHTDPFRDWARANMAKLLERFPVIRKYGFYVVTTTFTAKEVLINGWKNQSHKVTLAFGGNVESVGQISASTQIYGADSASGWVQPVCKGISALPRLLCVAINEKTQDNEEKVVFFGGLKYEYHALTGWMRDSNDKFKEQPQERWRGDNLIIKDPDVEDDALEIQESAFGDRSDY